MGTLGRHRFDLLLESGVQAFNTGFEAESVITLTSALERAQETFVCSTLHSQGVSLDGIDQFWKQVVKQSERQLGAFLQQWLIIQGTVYSLDENKVAFRNKVTHQGYIPLKSEVQSYGTYITEKIFDIVEQLRNINNDVFMAYRFHELGKIGRNVDHLIQHSEEFAGASSFSLHTPHVTLIDRGPDLFRRLDFSELCADVAQRDYAAAIQR